MASAAALWIYCWVWAKVVFPRSISERHRTSLIGSFGLRTLYQPCQNCSAELLRPLSPLVLSHAPAPLCLTLWNPMNCSPTGSSVRGIVQARTLEWVAISSFRGTSWPRDWNCITCVSCISGGFFTAWAVKAAPEWQCVLSILHQLLPYLWLTFHYACAVQFPRITVKNKITQHKISATSSREDKML